ncbi:asparaginase [Microbacterium sp. SORGH_AS_0888]|uniref:asparaginase n=1 Tax=Microbacterium sp. SORGH_AS_0888 TaxID=3041791 RepID=UPI0027828ABF|nr:asparaginase [Microbacterium sp. SORGH_AS_0888]MDQ1128011.1 L-asparaginase II [Microbacterium sp. SORGH_AS_0888]
MPQTFSPGAAAELAVVERSGFVESRHVGSAVVLGADGTVIRTLGDPAAPILPRSALKPLQALACLTAGAELVDEQLGLATASHSGTDRHVGVVRDILAGADLTEDDLACPPAWPEDASTRDELVRDLARPTRIRMTCSGKHAAMLRACRASGWDTDGYLEPAHPLQSHILQVVERLTGERPTTVATDGCGAPVPAVSLTGLARALHRMGTASERSPFAMHRLGAMILQAVRTHPWTVAGPGRPDTMIAERTGSFSKFGAEGVATLVAPDGTTVALKVLDGSGRAAAAVALTLLEQAGALAPAVVERSLQDLPLVVHGGGAPVGRIRPVV